MTTSICPSTKLLRVKRRMIRRDLGDYNLSPKGRSYLNYLNLEVRTGRAILLQALEETDNTEKWRQAVRIPNRFSILHRMEREGLVTPSIHNLALKRVLELYLKLAESTATNQEVDELYKSLTIQLLISTPRLLQEYGPDLDEEMKTVKALLPATSRADKAIAADAIINMFHIDRRILGVVYNAKEQDLEIVEDILDTLRG